MNLEKEIEKRQGANVVRLQRDNLGFSTCFKCGLPWNECESKSISSSDSSGVFAMCTFYWDNSTIEERLHHYKSLWYEHKNRWEHETDWSRIESEIRNISSMELKEEPFLKK